MIKTNKNLRIHVFEEDEENYKIKLFLELHKNGNVLFANSLYKKNELPTTLQGPTTAEIERFKEEHFDAKACPKCGYKYLVDVSGIYVAYVGGRCMVCDRLKNSEFC